MKVQDCVALVTGAGQGIGRGFVDVLLEQGARRIYATARSDDALRGLAAIAPDRVLPLRLDVTNAEDRRNAADKARDVTLLINNAGIAGGATGRRETRFIAAETLDDARALMETNYLAQAEMCRAFAPALLAAEQAAIVNILSIGALFCTPAVATYSASKAAAALMTQGIRAELAPHGILVAGVFTAGVETAMSRGPVRARITPIEHAREVLAAIEAGVEDIFAGPRARELRDEFLRDPKAIERSRASEFAREMTGEAPTLDMVETVTGSRT